MLLVVEDGEIPLVLGLAFCQRLTRFYDPLGKRHARPVDKALENICGNEKERCAEDEVHQRYFPARPNRCESNEEPAAESTEYKEMRQIE